MSVYKENREIEIFQHQSRFIEFLEINTPLIFDVGANVGQSIARYCDDFPECRLHCFEPNPEAFEKLNLLFNASSNVRLNNFALADFTGNASFFATRLTELSSLLQPESWLCALSNDDKYEAKELCVPCKTLDQYCQEIKVDWIDILKIDVQGAEPKVLKGGQQMLSNNRIGMIYLEVMLAETYVGQATLAQILNLLETYQYRLWDLIPFTYTSAGAAWTANALFVCPQWAKHVEEKSRQEIVGKPKG